MKHRIIIAVLAATAASSSLPAASPSASEVTIQDLFAEALKTSETMAIQTARSEQAQGRVNQAKSKSLPQVAVGANYLRQDVPADKVGSLEADQWTSKVTITQPIFHGFKDRAGYLAADLDAQAQIAIKEEARIALYSQLAQAYFTVLRAESDVENLKASLDVAKKRSNEIKERTRIGRSRKGDLYAAEAQEMVLSSQIHAAEATVDQAWVELFYLTGRERKFRLKSGSFADGNISRGSVDELVSKLDHRADLLALRKQVESAGEGIRVARSGHYPTVDVTGNYYLKRLTGSATEDSKWDLGVALSLPLYQGGMTTAQVQEGVAKKQERQLLYDQAKRKATSDVNQAFTNLQTSKSQLAILQRALELTEKNFKEQSRDYTNGLVTNLDVLQALNTFSDTKRNYDRQKIIAQESATILQATIGNLP